MATAQRLRLVAVDTNILLRLAEEEELTLDGIQAVRSRLRPVEFVVPPTAYQELAHLAGRGDKRAEGAFARKALTDLRDAWRFTPVPLNALQKALAVNASLRLLHAGLLPDAEQNDARIVAESAVLMCVLLVSNDSHLLDIDHRQLGLLFRELDLPVPIIASPRDLVKLYPR